MNAKYEVLGELGRGAMGVVYRAKQVDLDREVALKVLPVETKDGDMLRRFKREVKIACGLSHPHIVHIYDGGELDGKPFYAMEIIAGEELAHVIARGAQPFADVVRWAEQGADALAYVHAQGLCHRDLKPGNLMVNASRNLIVMDFGLAKDPTSTLLTEAGAVVGTPRYIAPEGYRGQEPGQPQDVYALALCMHEALLGASWDTSKSIAELAQRVIHSPPPTLAGRADVPAWFAEIEARALVKDPAARLTAAQYRDFLKRRGRGVVSRATRTSGALAKPAVTDGAGKGSSGGVATSPPGRQRAVVLGLAAALFAAGLAGAALLRPAPPAPAPAPTPALVAPTWPAHRRAHFAAERAPEGAELVVRAGARSWRGAAPSADLTLPPALDATVTLERGGQPLAGPLAFKTPALMPISHLHVQPTDVEVLVDFDLDAPTPVQVNIYRADGQRAAHTEAAAGERWFTHWFTGLRPETDYTIEVLGPEGWGGCAGYGFRTEALKQSAAVQEANRLIRSSPELVEYCLSVANKVPDRRMVPALLAWVRSDHPSVAAQIKKAAWIAEKTRSRELAGELAKRAMKTTEEQIARYVLNAMGQTRHPEAPAVGRHFLGKWDEGDSFVNAVKCLAMDRSPATVALLEPHLKRFHDTTRAAEWIARIDRAAAQALFRKMLAGPDQNEGSLNRMGCAGLAYLRDDADVPLLETIASSGEAASFGRGFAVQALVSIGSPAARAAIGRALAARPTASELLWAAGQLRLVDQAPRVLATFKQATGRLKKDAGCVLGLLGHPAAVPDLVAALDDKVPEVADAAAWALGRMQAKEAVAPLVGHATKAGDGPIFALGLLASPDASSMLNDLQDDPTTAMDLSRSLLIDWARRRSEGKRTPARELPLYGIAPFDRTEQTFEPGDVVRAWVSGTWRFGSNKDDVPARTQVLSNGTRAAPRIVIGGQLLVLDRAPTYFLIRHGGEALLTPHDFPPVHFNGIPTDPPRGFAVVHLEPQG